MAIFGFFVFFPEAMAIELPGSFQRSCASASHLELSLGCIHGPWLRPRCVVGDLPSLVTI